MIIIMIFITVCPGLTECTVCHSDERIDQDLISFSYTVGRSWMTVQKQSKIDIFDFAYDVTTHMHDRP